MVIVVEAVNDRVGDAKKSEDVVVLRSAVRMTLEGECMAERRIM